MSNFCDKCGHELKKDNAKFCDNCGAEIKINNNQLSQGATNVAGVVICPHCGQTTPMGQTHCEKCGLSLENNTTAVIVGYLVTFFFWIIGIIPAIYLFTRNNGKAKTQGIFLIGIIILVLILSFIFSSWVSYLITIPLMAVGIFLWYNDYSLF